MPRSDPLLPQGVDIWEKGDHRRGMGFYPRPRLQERENGRGQAHAPTDYQIPTLERPPARNCLLQEHLRLYLGFLIDKDQTILSQHNLVPISKLVSNSHGKFVPVDEHSSMAVLVKEMVIPVLFSQNCMVGRDPLISAQYYIVGISLSKRESIPLQCYFVHFI